LRWLTSPERTRIGTTVTSLPVAARFLFVLVAIVVAGQARHARRYQHEIDELTQLQREHA